MPNRKLPAGILPATKEASIPNATPAADGEAVLQTRTTVAVKSLKDHCPVEVGEVEVEVEAYLADLLAIQLAAL